MDRRLVAFLGIVGCCFFISVVRSVHAEEGLTERNFIWERAAENVKRVGPDAYGVVCYQNTNASAGLSCVKVR